MEDHRFREDLGLTTTTAAALSSSSPTSPTLPLPGKKIQSYSQQLNRSKPNLPDNLRNHSLEEDKFSFNGGFAGFGSVNNGGQEYKTRFEEDEDKFSFNGGFAGFGSVNNGGQEYKTRFEEDAQEEQIPSRTSSTNSNNNTNISLVHQNSQTQPLSEFIGNGGGNGIFTVPIRAAIPPDRPPSLELRPRPSRDTQLGLFLRVVGCSDEHLWAGHECGMRFWKFEEMYLGGGELDVRRGDESASPFYESEVGISPIFCMAMGMSSGIVWSGHKDGKIRLWEMDQCLDGTPFKESLVWRAHKGPILSLASSSYGDLWSGCEGGVVKVWPWESIEQSFSLKNDEINMASLLVEKSFIDLRAQVTVNGVCALSHTDVHFILADNSRGKVWSAGYQSFALWDARTRELVKVFNIDGQVSRADKPPARDPCVEDDTKTKISSSSKKDKSQNSLNFLQRSRNALLGAADAVRRVAGKGAFGDDHRTEAMVLTGDGMIWTGCSNGLLVQWDGNGTRLRDFNHHPFSVKCLCAFGARMWVGYVTGTIQVLNLDGSVLGEWIAHNSPIIDMAVGAGYVFTLANHGGIRGWNITSPGPLDDMLRSEVANKESLYTQVEKLNLMVGTWNVGQGKASHDSLIMWLGSAAEDASIIVVGLQEVEMGAGFLAISAARETVGIEGTSIGQWWLDTLGKSLDEGSTYERIGSRQLAGLLIALWVRKNLRPHIGDIDVAAVPCGLGHAIGNKGAVGLRIRVYDRVMCFVNCHLAAHLEAVNKRNADFNHIYRTMSFNKPNQINASSASNSPATELLQVTNAVGIHSEDRKPELSEADLVVFLGDLNYRLDGISYEEAKDFISQRSFDWLKEKDQLRAAMKAAKVFQGMREGYIAFPPTYKFQKHEAGLGGYDASEKKRIPAWCDRVLYRDNRLSSETECCLDCPIVSSIMQYDACMDVTDSDHKPVRCIFSVDVASIDESARRQEFGCIMEFHGKKLQEYVSDVPETTVSTNDVIIQNRDQYVLQLSNICRQNEAIFDIICEDQSTIKENGETHKHHLQIGFPRWLQINPAAGVIKPGEAFDISVAQEEFHTRAEYVDGVPQNWWCEDSRDKTVNLTVRVRGNCSITTKSHRVHVCHSFTATGMPVKSKPNLQSRSLPEKRESETGQSKAGIVQSKTLPHLPSASEDDMKGAKNYGVESMTLMQHLTSSFDAADPQQNLPLVEETSKSKSRKKKIKGIKSKSEKKSKEGKSKNGVPRHNGGDVKSKTPQLSDLKNLSVNSYSSDTQHGLRSPPTEENSKNGAQRSNSRGNQSKSLQQQLESQDIDCTSVVGGTEHNLPARSTKENLKTGAKDDSAGRTKKQAPEQPDAPTSEGMNKCGDRDKNVREVQPKMLHQPESQHLSRDTDGSQDTMHISSIMGKSKSGAEQINAQVMLEKTPVQSDTQTVSCSSVADGTKKSSQTPSVEEKSEKGEPEDKDKRNQQKTFEQPKSQQQKLSTTRKNDDGESKSKALLLESQQLDLPNVVNPFFDAADTLHPTSVRTKSKNTAQKDNASEIQPKPLQHPDSKHPSGSSDRQNSKKGNCENELQHPSHISDADQRLNIQSVEERDRKGVREGNARENQSMERKSKSGAEKNGYSDAAEPEHSSHTLPTRREDSTETLPQTDLEQPSCHSSDAENRKSMLKSPPLIVERNRSSDREDNAKGNQTKLLQPADTEHRLVSPLIDEKGKKDKDTRSRKEKSKNKGDAVDKKSKSKTPLVTEKRTSSDREEQSKHRPDEKTTFQQPYPESLNPFSDASDIEQRGTLTQPKPIQIPDPQTLNPFADSTAADSPQSMHSLSKKEKNKSARKQQESAANSPRCLHSPSKKETPSIEEKIKTRARKLFLP